MLTLVLRPAMKIERLMTEDFIGGVLAWISTERNPTNGGLTQGIHLTREFGADCYPE
jgi:hypothetical protein